MTKAEYWVTLKYCRVRCEPEEEKCKDCQILKVYKEVYGDERKDVL